MSFFSNLDWWHLVIGAVFGAVLSGAITECLHSRRRSTGEYQLWTEIIPRRLLSSQAEQVRDKLKILSSDYELKHPYLTDLYVWYAGEKDLRAEAFPGGRHFAADLGCRAPHIEQVGAKGNLSNLTLEDDLDGSAQLILRPGLLKVGDAAHYRLITDGDPLLRVDNPVADLSHYTLTHEKWGKTPRRQKLRVWKWGFFTVTTLIAVVTILWGATAGNFFDNVFEPIIIFISTLGIIIVGTFFWDVADRFDRRARRAERIVGKSLNTRIPDMSEVAAGDKGDPLRA